jgi:broad specificity phosphatase PhoE
VKQYLWPAFDGNSASGFAAPGLAPSQVATLRERRFGHWEASATGNYAHVWAADETDPAHAEGNVEPAAAVLDRATALIAQLERQHCDRDILLVSHGDTLQILQAGFSGVDPSRHRLLPHLTMAEIHTLRLREGSAGRCSALRLARDINAPASCRSR